MELYINFLTSVIKSLEKVLLPKIVGQNGVILKVSAKCEQVTCTHMSAKSIGQNGMIHSVPVKCDRITCTNMSA
jgi:hypothetical protein